MSQRTQLITELKRKWTSNFEANMVVMSSHGDRRIREIRETPIAGYDLVDMWVDAKTNIPRHKKYKLIRRK